MEEEKNVVIETSSVDPSIPSSNDASPSKMSFSSIAVGFAVLFFIGVIAVFVFVSGSGEDDDEYLSDDPNPIVENETVDEPTVSYLSGSATVDGEMLEEGSVLSEGNTIVTIADSIVAIALPDGSEVRLNQDTTLTLDTLVKDEYYLTLTMGSAYHSVETDDSRKYIVMVHDQEFEAVGTGFNTKYEEGATAEVTVLEGIVDPLDESFDETLGEGDVLTFSSQEDGTASFEKRKISNTNVNEDRWLSFNKDRNIDQGRSTGFTERKYENFIALEGVEFERSNEAEKSISLREIKNDARIQVENNFDRFNIVGSTLKEAELFVVINGVQSLIDLADGTFGYNFDLVVGENSVLVKSVAPNGDVIELMFVIVRAEAVEPTSTPSPLPEPTETLPTPTPEPKLFISSILNLDTSQIQVNTSKHHQYADELGKDGYKIVFSKDRNPLYGEDTSVYTEGSGAKISKDKFGDGGLYYFRVCNYIKESGNCNEYSPNYEYDVKQYQWGTPAISLYEPTVNGREVEISWTYENEFGGDEARGQAVQGFKVVWAKSGAAHDLPASYPKPESVESNEWGSKYFNSSSARTASFSIPESNAAGDYIVRVCRYRNGSCDVYGFPARNIEVTDSL